MTRPTLKDRAEQVAILTFVKVARVLPARAVPWMSRLLAVLVFDVLRYRRGVALANLMRHLRPEPRAGRVAPAAGPGARKLARDAVAGFILGLAEFARLPSIDAKYIEANIRAEGLEHLDGALKQGKGAVLVTGHFGSWEVMGCVLVKLRYPLRFVVGVQRNPLAQTLMNEIRRSCGIGIIEPDSLLGAIRALKSNCFVGMLSDQDVGHKGTRGVFVDFMGEPAWTARGAAQLAVYAGCPIIPGFIIRTGCLKHRIVIEKPIWPTAGREESDIHDITQAYTRVIEAYAMQYPDHWLWTHRRWKTKPA
jgi:KDO2-lipid IV(A) lauroyltransferase